MGVLFRITCDTCHSRPNVTFDGFVGAALNDADKPGDIVADGYLAYLTQEGELIVLPHPMESSRLASAGGSWTKSGLNGQILRFTNLICHDCGTINKTAEIHSSGLGCTTGFYAGIATIALNIWLFDLPRWVEFGLFWASLMLPMLLADWYVRRKHSCNAIPYQFTNCVNCNGTDASALTANRNKKLPCVKCGEKSVTISFGGKS